MSVFATWFGTRSFLFIGRKSARRRHACITGCPEGDTIWILLPATIGCRLHRICPRGNGMFRS